MKLHEVKLKPLYAREGPSVHDPAGVFGPSHAKMDAVQSIKKTPEFQRILDLGFKYVSTQKQEANGTLQFETTGTDRVEGLARSWRAGTSSHISFPVRWQGTVTGMVRQNRAGYNDEKDERWKNKSNIEPTKDLYQTLSMVLKSMAEQIIKQRRLRRKKELV